MTMLKFTVAILVLILTINYGSGSRSIKEESSLLSDGMDQTGKSSVLELDLPTTTTVTCEPIYGFLPCTTTLWGQLFLLVVYEYLLSLSEEFISSGSNLFFQMFGTGIFGASLFHILGMIPQIMLVLVSGASASEETIEARATMGMGLLAGSAVLMLTLVWGSVIAFGSYDLSDTSSPNSSNPDNADTSISSNATKKKPFSLTGYGVRTDIETRYSAIIMLLSMVPFLILQLAKFLSSATAIRVVVLISLIVTLALLGSYCTYQVFKPWIQDRRLEYLMRRYVQKNLLHRLVSANGRANEFEIKKLFHKIDKNNNSRISPAELRAFILGIQIEEVGLDEEDFETKVMEEFDSSGDSDINETEFVRGVSIWLNKANNVVNDQAQGVRRLFHFNEKKNNEEKQSLLPAKKRSKGRKGTDNPWWNYTKAAFLITLGTAITVMLANPLMITLQEFSTSANIPSFLVSYVVIPWALSFRQSFRAVSSARQKTEDAASLTFSELYGAVFMNNVMGLVIFLSLVYIRNIPWGVSAEVLVVLLICTAMGLFATFSTKMEIWTCILVYLLYPISLLLIYVLTNVLGWS
ncbi:sodium/calcium exchanger NCL1-like [Herrania umbratica]|uniref:Sodium/calcium exchanger NCL1-like n=1 Tax=Herrania umbratica TaxID=108875 RepID=A0A6J1B3U4_9ROSI|nr:sodium/calcium exchanger NCL1-like [Herrania umbratica]